MDSAVKSIGLFLILLSLSLVSGLIYIDKVAQDSNIEAENISISYTHDKAGNAVTNVTYETFVTISKVMLYFTLKITDTLENTGVSRDLIKTVIDLEKLLQGSQANPLMKAYFDNIIRSMNYTLKFPLPPVSLRKQFETFSSNFRRQGTYKMCNVTIDTSFLHFLTDFKGSVDFRMVGKYGKSKKMRFLSHLAISGGYRRG